MSESSVIACENSEKKNTVVSVVPWYNAAQFKKVYQYLYSPEIEKKRWALDEISVWETRCHPSLPSAIEASYGLTSAIVQDILWTNSVTVNQQIDIQYLYSSAITRFVNLTVDIHDDHVYRGTTMAQLAKGLGIPSFIIDLRNEASHSVRPSLPCLRIAAAEAMKYLEDSYWKVEASRVKNHIKKPMDENETRQLICKYIKIRLCLIQKHEKKPPQHDDQDVLELKKCMQSMEKLIMKNKQQFVKILTMDGLFIPLTEDLKCMISAEEYDIFQSTSDEKDTAFDLPVHESKLLPEVPDMHEQLWQPVIEMLNKYDAVPTFMETLLRSQRDRTIVGQKLLISWVVKILRIHSVNRHFEDTCLRSIFRKKGIVANWHSMLYSAISNPTVYTGFVFPLIFCHLELSEKSTRRLLNLVAIYIGQLLGKDDPESLPKRRTVFTAELFLRVKKLQNAEREKKKGYSEECIWSAMLDDRHKMWPIGHINNPIKKNDENEDEEVDEENFDVFFETVEYADRNIISNENDIEEEYCEIDIDRPDTFEKDIAREISRRKCFLYRK